MRLLSRRNLNKTLFAGGTSLALCGRSASSPTTPGPELEAQASVSKDRSGNSVASPRGASPRAFAPESDSNLPPWSDVVVVAQPEPIISYRTGWVVYEESLTKGAFVGRGW